MNKYNARKTEVDGIKFDSKAEAKRYQELKRLEYCRDISDLQLQPEFELLPKLVKNGKTYRKTTYKADFSYFDKRANKYIIEDVKGVVTPVYALKKKLFEHRYAELEITEVKR